MHHSDQGNQQKFSDRLSRIQEKQAVLRPDVEETVSRRGGGRPKGGPSRGLLLSVVAIPALFGGLGFAYVTQPEKFSLSAPEKAGPEEAPRVALKEPKQKEKDGKPSGLAGLFGGGSVVSLTGKSGGAKPGKPAEPSSIHGTVVPPGQVLGPDGLIDLAQVATVIEPQDGDTPGAMVVFDRQTECSFRAPATGEKVVSINIGAATGPMPIQVASTAQMADAVLKNIRAVTQKGKDELPVEPYRGEMRGADVFVTETEAPVYLVLQTMGPGVVWQVHAAPDARIAHVAMVGQRPSGVIAPPGTTYQSIEVPDFVTPHEFGKDDEIRPCMVRPWRAPKDDWEAMARARKDNQLYVNQMESFTKGRAAYAAWFTQVFGTGPDTNEIEAPEAQHVLVGPVPATPVPYTPLAGAEMALARADIVITGTDAERDAALLDIHTDLLMQAVRGNIENLRPEPMMREVGQ